MSAATCRWRRRTCAGRRCRIAPPPGPSAPSASNGGGGRLAHAIPYHRELPDSGEPTEGGAIIDLQQYDEQRLQATFKSRMVGQDWQFSVRASAAVVDGGMLEPRAKAPKTRRARAAEGAVSDATARKRALARLGYEFTEDEFFRAIQEGTIAAVDLFIELGMKGTATKSDGTPAIVAAAMSCSYDPKEPGPR